MVSTLLVGGCGHTNTHTHCTARDELPQLLHVRVGLVPQVHKQFLKERNVSRALFCVARNVGSNGRQQRGGQRHERALAELNLTQVYLPI